MVHDSNIIIIGHPLHTTLLMQLLFSVALTNLYLNTLHHLCLILYARAAWLPNILIIYSVALSPCLASTSQKEAYHSVDRKLINTLSRRSSYFILGVCHSWPYPLLILVSLNHLLSLNLCWMSLNCNQSTKILCLCAKYTYWWFYSISF